MGLQLVYLVPSVYGWYQWLHGGAQRSRLQASRGASRAWAIAAAVSLVFSLPRVRSTSTLPGVSPPYGESGPPALSLVARCTMTRKMLESCTLWIIANTVY